MNDYKRKLRSHLLDPETKAIPGTYGLNRARRTSMKLKPSEGVHYYNEGTGMDVFIQKDKNGRRSFKSGWILNPKQRTDVVENKNLSFLFLKFNNSNFIFILKMCKIRIKIKLEFLWKIILTLIKLAIFNY